MDVEAAAAIGQLNERFDGLADEMREVRSELRALTAEVRAHGEQLGDHGEQLRSHRALLREHGEELRALRIVIDSHTEEFRLVRQDIADGRRHTSVLFESLQDQIRVVAEGVATIAARLDNRS